ncbi:SDR family NAD(P)-dependent oxidoreductase [Streptomyces sp. S1A(2023)]
MSATGSSTRRSPPSCSPAPPSPLPRSGRASSFPFAPGWEPAAARPADTAAVTARDVLLVVATGDTGRAWIPTGVRVARVGQDLAGDAASWTAYLADLRARGIHPRGLVFDLPAGTTSPQGGMELVLPAVRALIADREAGPLPVAFLVTGRACPELAPALGAFAQVTAAEDRRLKAVSVQVDEVPAWAEGPLQVALAELSAARPGLAEVRHGPAGREVRVLRPRERDAGTSAAPVFREGGRYLITGGGRGIGLRIAALLARDHRARLLLTGRSEADAGQLAEFRDMERGGARVVYVRGDITRYEDALESVAVAEREFGGLDGVLHSAGLNEDAYLINKETESARRVLSVKLDGAAHLDRVTSNLPLDFLRAVLVHVGILRCRGTGRLRRGQPGPRHARGDPRPPGGGRFARRCVVGRRLAAVGRGRHGDIRREPLGAQGDAGHGPHAHRSGPAGPVGGDRLRRW